jgi:hypothetical protein
VIDDPDGERGRGLLLVQALSVRTGFVGDQRGRLVWAQIAWTDPNGAASAQSQDPYRAAIRDGETALARRFAAVPAWFGRATLCWWALPNSGDLVSAPSAPELAALLYQLEVTAPTRPDATGDPRRATDEEPGPALTQEPGGLPQHSEPGIRPRPSGNRGDDRGRRGRPDRWPPDEISCRTRVLSGNSRPAFVYVALPSGTA